MKKKNHGFTLIELIVTVAVFSILAAVAAPAFNAFTDSSRRAGEVNLFSSALSYARSEAIKRNSTISICARTSGAETCSGSDDWENGWLVFDNADNDSTLDGDETLLRVFKPISPGSAITEVSSLAMITYRGSGFMSNANSAEFKYCGNRGAIDARAIMISRTGRANLSSDGADADKIHEDSSGTNLACP